ncbi:E3 ubiquitin-protein ligase ATL4-like [Phragmites australis]|uniref:E3 ubiquitin-protein ligase ATL4-like n=1 Tax=Phragmites australis TaxID=29695 RepID=UPI002D7669F4|nr:E3 ubiquitin-protein ligase ATL4-like [Phragmites australis]
MRSTTACSPVSKFHLTSGLWLQCGSSRTPKPINKRREATAGRLKHTGPWLLLLLLLLLRLMASLPPPTPLVSGGVDPLAANIPPSLPSPPPSSSLNLSPSLLIIAALLVFVLFASVSIHFLLRYLARASSSHPAPSPLPRASRTSEAEAEADAQSSRRSAAAAGREQVEVEVDDEKERLIASLPLFTMASALAALPKSSPDCAVCLSPFAPDVELRLLPACRHAFHAACVDAWLRTTPSCPLCRTAVSFPLPTLPTAAAGQEPLDSRMSSNNNSRSFRVEIGSVSNRRSSAAGDDRRTYSLGSFDYRVDEEVEAVVSRIARPAAAAKSTTQTAPATPGEALAEAAGSRGWLREYVDRLASSASSLSGRWSGRWSQGQRSHRYDDSWRWDPEAAMHRAPDEEEPGFVALYRWIVGV